MGKKEGPNEMEIEFKAPREKNGSLIEQSAGKARAPKPCEFFQPAVLEAWGCRAQPAGLWERRGARDAALCLENARGKPATGTQRRDGPSEDAWGTQPGACSLISECVRERPRSRRECGAQRRWWPVPSPCPVAQQKYRATSRNPAAPTLAT